VNIQSRHSGGRKLGTFLGVFTPTILTILGVIMYLRLGWVTGTVGLGKALLVVGLANSISLITTLSFSAIATNTRIGVGGAYYIISRGLGLEFGGAIGLPLFLSQAASVTLYSFGLAESLRIVWPQMPVAPVAFGIVVGVGALAYRGAGLALKIQLPLMGFIAISLAALAVGALRAVPAASVDVLAGATDSAPAGFWVVFAVFFPAVTGIMAGLGLSGDLQDPVRSIPRGAITACVAGFVVYLAIPILLARAVDPALLRSDPLVWTKIAPLGAWLILPGLWGAIFSSAVGSMLGAPRTLQALAMDRLAPRRLGEAAQGRGEPALGLAVSLGLALAAVLLGDLNAVAPVVSMFFLTVYGMVNLLAALESLSGDPSWRPRLQVPWPVCLAGALACLVVMLLISPLAALAAVVVETLLWLVLARRERKAGWGDVRRGVYESLIRWSLLHLARRPMNPRNWRPHVLVFADDVEKHLDLVHFGVWFSQGRGVVTVCELLVGDLVTEDFQRRERKERILRALHRERLVAFGEVDVVRDVIHGIVDVSQANGIAGLDSNTILLGWPKEVDRLIDLLHVVQRLDRLHKSVVIGRIQPGLIPRAGEERTIHIWWGGLQRNGDLMLLMAHLLTRNAPWRDAHISILSLASNEHMKTNTESFLDRLLPEIRIAAAAEVMILPRDRTVLEVIHERSAEADVVFLGLDVPGLDAVGGYAERITELAAPLRTVFFVKNATLFVGELVQTSSPEEQAPVVEQERSEAEESSP
jgi:potassium/chloride transporter 4/5/6